MDLQDFVSKSLKAAMFSGALGATAVTLVAAPADAEACPGVIATVLNDCALDDMHKAVGSPLNQLNPLNSGGFQPARPAPVPLVYTGPVPPAPVLPVYRDPMPPVFPPFGYAPPRPVFPVYGGPLPPAYGAPPILPYR
jgi:hypothetical protein